MRAEPEFTEFARTLADGKSQIVWTTLVADVETPVSAFLKLADGRPNSFLFESVEGGATIGRYSFLGLKPDLIWRCRGGKAEVNRRARFDYHIDVTFEAGLALQGTEVKSLRAGEATIAESYAEDGQLISRTVYERDRPVE